MKTKIKYLPRKIRTGIHTWVKWHQQGKPTNGPVVIRQGSLTLDADGKRHISDWHWDPHYQTKTVTREELWDFLAARYPVQDSPK